MSFSKNIVKPFLKIIFKALFRVKINGTFPEIPPAKLLITANHESFLDGLLLGLFLPFNATFVVHTSVTENLFFRMVLSMVDYVTVDPTSPMAMKTLAKIIDKGIPVVIFPEGRITTTGSLMKIYEGPAFLAAKTGATVLPVRLDGPARTYFSRLSGQHPKQIFPQISISFQPLTKINMPNLPKAKERRMAAGEELRKILQLALFKSTKSSTLWQNFNETAQIYGLNKPVIQDVTLTEFSYKQILKAAIAISLWTESKIKNFQQKRCAVLLPNLAPLVGIIFGFSARNITPCMLNYTSGVESILSALAASECKFVISSNAFIKKANLDHIIDALVKNNITILWLEELKANITFFDKLNILFFLLFPKKFNLNQDPNSEAIVLFTSGSEGTPKGVILSHKAILSNAAQIKSVMDINVEDKFLCALPLFHSFGLTAGTILPILSGSSLFLYPTPLHYRIIPEIAYDKNCTVLFGTNTFLAQYGKMANPYNFYKIRRVIAGAEKLQDSTRELWNDKFGIRIFEGYGATETAPVLSVNTPMNFKRGSVGQFLPDVQYNIIPIPGVENGGLLQVTGPNLMTGYLKASNPGKIEKPACESGDGWHNLGDIVEIDKEGYIFIKGRLKRFAKIAGEMVSFEVAEKIAQIASPTQFHAVVSKSDPSKGEALVLFTTDKNLNREMLLNAAKSSGNTELAISKDIRFLEKIPVLGTGKTDYVSINKLLES